MAMKRPHRLGLAPGVSVRDRARFRELLAILGVGLEDRLQEPVGLAVGSDRGRL